MIIIIVTTLKSNQNNEYLTFYSNSVIIKIYSGGRNMQEINPKDTNRAKSFELYINAPMPMVTIFKTLDISHLMKLKKDGYKLNMLMCYCIALAASEIKEFYLLPIGQKMFQYDKIGLNVIVANNSGTINTCDIPFSCNLFLNVSSSLSPFTCVLALANNKFSLWLSIPPVFKTLLIILSSVIPLCCLIANAAFL